MNALLLPSCHRHKIYWIIGVGLFIFCYSAYVMISFIWGTDFLGRGIWSLREIITEHSLRPHMYRQLPIIFAKVISAITPKYSREAITFFLHNLLREKDGFFYTLLLWHGRNNGGIPELEDPYLYPTLLILLLNYMCLLGYVYYVWRSAQSLFPTMFTAQMFAPFFAILAIPPVCGRFAWYYDFPILFFSAWLTFLLIHRRLNLFTMGVALATINKETSIFLIALFALWGWQALPRDVFKRYLILQCILYFCIKLFITFYFRHTDGLLIWTSCLLTHVFVNMDGYEFFTFLGEVLAIALLGYRWAEKPQILKCWMVIAPFSVLAWLICGGPFEIRVMYEIFPGMVLAASHSMAMMLQIGQNKREVYEY